MAETAQKTAASETAASVTVIDNTTGKTVEFPVRSGTLGPKVIDVRKLYAETGMFTYDPGYTSTGSTESAITFIDGQAGVRL